MPAAVLCGPALSSVGTTGWEGSDDGYRATISLTLAAKAWALMQGRSYVIPQDIKEIGMDVLRHRVIPTYEAEAENLSSEALVKRVFELVEVP